MSNQVALITGGATGIGKAVALKLAAKGVTVVMSGRRAEVGQAAVAEVSAAARDGAKVRFVQNDVADEAAVQSMIDGIVAEFGRLDMAVNNAGLSNETGTLLQSNSDNYRAMVDTNVMGVYFSMKHELAQMVKQGGGAIVNLASIAGLNGIAWAGPYGSTKHAVVGLTKSSALDHATQGIRVNGVAPGAVKTDIIAAQLEGGDPNYNEASISAMHPMNRLGRPEEVANAICWLLSDEASFVTGHILNVDGGFQAKTTPLPDKMKIPPTLWEGLKRAGLDRAEVVRRANLSLSVVKDNAPITTLQFFAVWQAIETVSAIPMIGLRIASGLEGAVMPLAFVAAYHARDFRDALQRVARFKRLCSPEDVLLTESDERGEIVIHWPHAGTAVPPNSLVDATMVSFVELGRSGTGEHLVPLKVELKRSVASRPELERYFGCQITFRAANTTGQRSVRR